MSTINTVAGSDTPNTGRQIWNANDTAMNADLEDVISDLTTHKSSADHDARYAVTSHTHDSRYYTETEIDAMSEKLTGNQTVAGTKTHTSDLVVSKAAPAVNLIRANGDAVGRVLGIETSAVNDVALQAWDQANGSYVYALKSDMANSKVDSPDLDMYSKGEKLATERYVQARLRSGIFILPLSRSIASLAASTTYEFLNPQSTAQSLIVPEFSRIQRVMFNGWNQSLYGKIFLVDEAANYQFVGQVNRGVVCKLITSSDSSGVHYAFKVYMRTVFSFEGLGVIDSEIYSYASDAKGLPRATVGSAWTIDVSLQFAY